MTYTTILTETRGRVGIVQLNRPQAMNAFNLTMLGEVFDAMEAFDKDETVGAIVVTGRFCAENCVFPDSAFIRVIFSPPSLSPQPMMPL